MCTCVVCTLTDCKHAAGGRLQTRSPDDVLGNITLSTLNTIDSSFPASKGNVRASVHASASVLEAELEGYQNETSRVINALVSKVNALTPVGS